MKISVHSRQAVQDMTVPTEPHIIVSINCPGDEPARIRTTRATLGRADLFFWDLDMIPQGENVTYLGSPILEKDLCQVTDAAKVVDLAEAHLEEAKEIIIHCTAGRSRSAAVAAALHKVLNGSDEPIFGNNRYSPNMRVYRMVLEEWYSRHPLE